MRYVAAFVGSPSRESCSNGLGCPRRVQPGLRDAELLSDFPLPSPNFSQNLEKQEKAPREQSKEGNVLLCLCFLLVRAASLGANCALCPSPMGSPC